MEWRRDTQYNFLNVFDKVVHIFKETLDYWVGLRNGLGMLSFYLTIITYGIVVIPISFILFNVLHGMDLFFITVLEKTTKGLDEDSPQWKQFISVTIALTLILPTIAFYTPAIIYYHFKDKRDAKIEREREDYERARLQTERDLARWATVDGRLTDFVKKKDFKPKKNIKAHNFTEHNERFISPGVYIIERDHVIINRRRRVGRRYE